MPTWTLQFDAQPTQEMAAVGISEIQRRLSTQADDTASLTFREADLRRAVPHAHGSRVRIFRDGAGWFTGMVDTSPRASQGGIPSLTIEVQNPWAEINRKVYKKRLRFVDSASISLGSDLLADYPLVTKNTSVVLLNEDETGTKVDTSEFLKVAVRYAIAAGANVQLGTIEPGVDIPREEFRGAVCTELIRACLRWTPDLTTWFDYSFQPPKLNVTKRRSKFALNLDTQTTVCAGIQLTPRPDLVVQGVTLEYLRVHDRPSFQFKTLDLDFAGVVTGQQISRPIELYGSRWNDTQKLNDAEPLPVGVAARVLESLNDLHYEGTIEIVADDCPAGSYLGCKLNLANSSPEHASMNADIRGQIDTVSRGRTTIEVGPPPQLGAADFVELLRAGRPVQALTVTQQTDSGSGIPLPTPLPPPATGPNSPPSAGFAPESPDYVLLARPYLTGYSEGGGANLTRIVSDFLSVYNPDGSEAGTLSATDITVIGSIVSFFGFKVGRAPDAPTNTIHQTDPDHIPIPVALAYYETLH